MRTKAGKDYSFTRCARFAGLIVVCEIVAILILLNAHPFLRFLPYGKLSLIATEPVEFEESMEGFRVAGKIGNLIDNQIYYMGSWELFELYALRDFLRDTAGPSGVFLDIGANIGVHSLYMSRFAAKVASIEPYPPVLERFRKSLELNHISNIRIYPVGYSNEEGELPFYAPPESNLGTGSFDASFSTENRLLGYLPLVVGDRHLAAEGISRVDLIKVDIEGYERYALLGLTQTLRTNRPIVVFELNLTDGGFKTRDQLMETFPENYEFRFLELDVPPNFVPYYSIEFQSYIYMFGPGFLGRYTITPYDFSFTRQVNMVAIPVEKIERLSIKN